MRFQLVLSEDGVRAAGEVHDVAGAGWSRLPGGDGAHLAGVVAGAFKTTRWPMANF